MSALALVAMLCAAAPDAGTSTPSFFVPDVIERVDVPGDVFAYGIPVKISAVRSRRGADYLLQYFATQFEKAGLFVPPTRDQPQYGREPMLTGLDVKTYTSYSVILQPNADGTTNVILGEGRVGEKRPQGAPDFAPIPPGATSPFTSSSEGADMLTFEVPADGKGVIDFYDTAMPSGGYKKVSAGRYTRPGDEVSVKALKEQDGKVQVMVVHRKVAQ